MKALVTAALSAVLAGPALAGTKTVVNTSGDTIRVTVVSRGGSTCTSNGASASVTVGANSSTTLNYPNTFVNSITIAGTDGATKAKFSEKLACTATGNPPTLDNTFNANSTFVVGYTNNSVIFSAHN